MLTEMAKMVSGALYDPMDAELMAARRRARLLCHQFNASRDDEPQARQELLRQLLAAVGEGVIVEPPFFCDYGANITLGAKVFFNFQCVILDVAPVSIGSYTLFGPNVQIYTATHPLNALERRRGLEAASPIVIGDDVWVGGSAIVCPGVRIGSRSVIGAGSVVTRDVPEDVVAVGNPCRVIKSLV